MTHTPGPWFVSMKPDWDEDGGMGPAVYDCDGGVFAVVDDEPETIARPFYEADARLIAAAPEMLEVLEWLSDSYGVLFTEQDSRRVHAVIRKARGVDEASVPDCKGRE